jgi:hypothetical protein
VINAVLFFLFLFLFFLRIIVIVVFLFFILKDVSSRLVALSIIEVIKCSSDESRRLVGAVKA